MHMCLISISSLCLISGYLCLPYFECMRVSVCASAHVCVKETAGNLSNDIAFTHLVLGDAQKDEEHGKPVTRKEKKE